MSMPHTGGPHHDDRAHGGIPHAGPGYAGPGHPGPAYGGVPAAGGVSSSDRTAAALSHAASLIALVVTAGWLSFVGPLVMWLIYKDRSPFVRESAAGSFNFNVGMWVMNVVAWICFFTVIGIPVAIVLWIISGLGQIIGHVLGTVRALEGRQFRYPFQIRLLR